MEHNKSIVDQYSREEKLGFGQRLRFEFSLLQLDDQAEEAKSCAYLVGFGRISLDLYESQLVTSSRLLHPGNDGYASLGA